VGQPFFNDEVTTQWLYVGMAFAILLPCSLSSGAVPCAGKPRLVAATAGALLALVTLLLGGLANALYVIDPLELQDTDVPYATFGVLILVIGAATVAASSALAYWAPKIWGRNTSNGLSLLAVLAGFLGAVIGGVALVVNGFQVRIDSLADASGF
jgi:heme/copper-type cytochrome/quinol oxidase subunit 1